MVESIAQALETKNGEAASAFWRCAAKKMLIQLSDVGIAPEFACAGGWKPSSCDLRRYGQPNGNAHSIGLVAVGSRVSSGPYRGTAPTGRRSGQTGIPAKV
nr:hypothetical protein [Mesorhizobium sp.]